MNNIKTYETFDFNKSLPITSKDVLTNYYYCDDCEGLWKEVNHQDTKCKFCHSEPIEELNVDEWYSMVEDRLEDDEIEELRKEREKEEGEFINLFSLRKDKKRYVN